MRYFFIFTFVLFSVYLSAQSNPNTDKFIRIVGLAETEINNDGLVVEFTLSEIAGNEYKQIRPRDINEIKQDFIIALKELNIDEKRVIEDKLKNITKAKYGKVKVRYYHIEANNEDEAVQLSQLLVDGFKVSSVKYRFPDFENKIFDDLSVSAIKDARRKAESIASSIGRKVGEILNIEETKDVSNKKTSKYESSNPSKEIQYRVNVTFELK